MLTFWKDLMTTPAQLAGYGGVFHGQAKTWAPPLSAIRLFLRSVVEKGGLPMDLPRGNPTTLAAIRGAKAGKTIRTTLEDF